MNNAQATNYLHAITTAYGPDEPVIFARETWTNLRTAIRVVIEQAQEPVAWVGPSWMNPKTRWQNDAFSSTEIAGWIPLYTAPSREKNS